jgi:drug/metabolite transporter (DMT)-like permease
MFVAAGCFFGTFGMLLRLWKVDAIRATVVVSLVSFVVVPLHWAIFGLERMIAMGLWENLLQAAVQGLLAGPGAIYLFVRSVVLLGASRAAVFPSLVPGFTLLIGWLLLGEVPSLWQVLGFTIVLIGFRLTQRT